MPSLRLLLLGVGSTGKKFKGIVASSMGVAVGLRYRRLITRRIISNGLCNQLGQIESTT
jgi:hypothetical protein